MNGKDREVIVTVGTLETLASGQEHERRLLARSLEAESGYMDFSNYETYRTNSYLEQEEQLKEAFTTKASALLEKHQKQKFYDPVQPHEKARFDLAKELQNYFDKLREIYILDTNSRSLLHGAYLMVNWEEIAANILNGI